MPYGYPRGALGPRSFPLSAAATEGDAAPQTAAGMPRRAAAKRRRATTLACLASKNNHHRGYQIAEKLRSSLEAEGKTAWLEARMPDKSEAAPQHIERNPSVLDVQAISTLTETYVRAHASLAHHPAKIARVALARRFGRMHDGAPTGGRNPSGR